MTPARTPTPGPQRPLRVLQPVQLARRVVIGIGLADVRDLEERLAAVIEPTEENAALAGPLGDQVSRLEQALIPMLERRAKRRQAR